MVGSLRIGTGLSQRYESFRWTRVADIRGWGDSQTIGSIELTPGMCHTMGRLWWEPTRLPMAVRVSLDPSYGPSQFGHAWHSEIRFTIRSVKVMGCLPMAASSLAYVTTSADEYYKAFRWTVSGGYDVIGLPPVTNGIPAGGAGLISADGSVIAGSGQTGGDINAWTWTAAGGFASVPPGPGSDYPSASVNGISFDGSVLVGTQILWNQPAPNPNGVIYSAAFWRNSPSGYQFSFVEDVLEEAGVDLTGWHLTRAYDVSDNGRAIIGDGIDPRGVQRSWYAILPVPEPTSLVSMSVGVIVMFGLLRQTRICGLWTEFLRDATGTLDVENKAGSVTAEQLHEAILVARADVY